MLQSIERIRDQRIDRVRPLVSPALLSHELPLSDTLATAVVEGRQAVSRIVNGDDDRLLVVVGPCSVHDPAAALDYAQRLRERTDALRNELCIVMRVYFEKPRTVTGWKGLINDPHLDGSGDVTEGLRLARRLLLDVVGMGLPVGCEFLDPIIPQYIADTVSWGAIGARTVESQVHRQLASGLSMPVGFKNGTGGGIQMAIDAVRAASHPHSFLGVTEQGLAGIVVTTGNPSCHVILRGGRQGPNYDRAHVQRVLGMLRDEALTPRVMIDASHDNSGKDHRRQPDVVRNVATQIAEGERGIIGLMIESFLVEGRQDLVDPAHLVYGQSVTDACIGWDTTVDLLQGLAAAVRERRAAASRSSASAGTRTPATSR